MFIKLCKSVRLAVISGFVAVVAGCASYTDSDTSQRLTFVLHQDISVETSRARVFIQHGQVVTTGQLETYAPSCDIEVQNVSQAGSEQVIKADEFDVSRIYYAPPDYSFFSIEENMDYAQEGFERPNTTYLTEFTLHSQTQPQVLRLNCKIWSLDVFQQYLTVAQITETLGQMATLKSL